MRRYDCDDAESSLGGYSIGASHARSSGKSGGKYTFCKDQGVCCKSLASAACCLAVRLISEESSKIRRAQQVSSTLSRWCRRRIGRLCIGRRRIGRLCIGRWRIGRLCIGRLCIGRWRIGRLWCIRLWRIRLWRIRLWRIRLFIFPSISIFIFIHSQNLSYTCHTRLCSICYSFRDTLKKSTNSHSVYISYFSLARKIIL